MAQRKQGTGERIVERTDANIEEHSLLLGAGTVHDAAGDKSHGDPGFNTLRVSELTLGREGLEKKRLASNKD